MSSITAFSTIKTYLDANWSSTPLYYPNDDTTPPEPPSAFVFVEMTGIMYDKASLGAPNSNLYRENGLLWLHCMVPSGSGSETARTHLSGLADLFKDKSLPTADGEIRFRAAVIGYGSPGDDEGNYWRLSMNIEWERDDN